MNTITEPVAERVRGAAFRHLARTGAPTTAAQLAADLEYTEPAVQDAIDGLARHGSLRLDDQGQVVGSAGLSIQPDRHEIDLDGHRFWTWCAYDILGIFAALHANGLARSTSPDTGQPVEIHFRDGQPEPVPLVLFRPNEDYAACCTNTYEQWCPNSNLFHTTAAATAWADDHHVTGTVLSLPRAAEHGARDWLPLTRDL